MLRRSLENLPSYSTFFTEGKFSYIIRLCIWLLLSSGPQYAHAFTEVETLEVMGDVQLSLQQLNRGLRAHCNSTAAAMPLGFGFRPGIDLENIFPGSLTDKGHGIGGVGFEESDYAPIRDKLRIDFSGANGDFRGFFQAGHSNQMILPDGADSSTFGYKEEEEDVKIAAFRSDLTLKGTYTFGKSRFGLQSKTNIDQSTPQPTEVTRVKQFFDASYGINLDEVTLKAQGGFFLQTNYEPMALAEINEGSYVGGEVGFSPGNLELGLRTEIRTEIDGTESFTNGGDVGLALDTAYLYAGVESVESTYQEGGNDAQVSAFAGLSKSIGEVEAGAVFTVSDYETEGYESKAYGVTLMGSYAGAEASVGAELMAESDGVGWERKSRRIFLNGEYSIAGTMQALASIEAELVARERDNYQLAGGFSSDTEYGQLSATANWDRDGEKGFMLYWKIGGN